MRYDDDDLESRRPRNRRDEDEFDFRRRPIRRAPDGWFAGLIIAIVVGVPIFVGLGIAAFAFLASLLSSTAPKGSARTVVVNRARDRQEAIEAFHNPQEAPPDVALTLQVFFDDLNRGMHVDYSKALSENADLDRMCNELVRRGIVQPMAPRQRQSFMAGFQKGLRRGGVQQVSWTHAQIKRVRPLQADFSEVVVFVRMRDDQGVSDRQRWWLRRKGDAWRWFDMEALDEGVGVLSTAGAAAADPKGPWIAAMPRFNAMVALEQQGKWGEVEKAGRQLEAISFPPAIRAIILVSHGSACIITHKYQEAADLFAQAERLAPDMPRVHQLQAETCNILHQPEQSLRHARQYLEQLGDDAVVYHAMGTAYRRLQQPKNAADAFTKGLDDDPDDINNLVGLCQVFLDDPIEKLTPERKTDLARRVNKLSKPEEQMAEVFDSFVFEKKQTELLETLLSAFLARVPASVEGGYYDIRLKILQGQTEAACKALPGLLGRVTDEKKRDEYVSVFLSSMTQAGKPVEGYRAAPDAGKAFKTVADELIENGQPEELRALIEEHRKRQPDDVWLSYYSGQAHRMKQEYALAEADFSNGLKQAKLKPQEKDSYRGEFIDAAFEAGHAFQAYEAVDDKKAAFEQLADCFAGKPDANGLSQLIEKHSKDHADDPQLPRWQAEAKWLDKDYEAVVDILTKNRARILAEKRNQWVFTDLLIRSLAYLKRTDEALRELHAADPKPGNHLLEAVVPAIAGDVAATEKALAECAAQHYDAGSFHQDPDLGPILRSEAFKELCAKYPDPRPKEPAK